MKLFVAIYNDARLLPHFLAHYEVRGVSEFFIAVAPGCLPDVERAVAGHPVTLFSDVDVADIAETVAVTHMRHLHQGADEWVAIVDLDEFVETDDLRVVAAAAGRSGANVVRGIMHDRFSTDGGLPGFSSASRLADVYPVKSRFIREVMRGCDHKGVLVRGALQGATGALHHWFSGERAFRDVLEISHYKWTEGAVERLRRSHQVLVDAGVWYAIEYQRALDHYDRNGRFAWETFGGALSRHFTVEMPAGWCSHCGGAISESERDFSMRVMGRMLCRSDQAMAP